MVVVPAAAHRRQGQPEHVAALVAGAVRARAEAVREGIDRPGGLVDQEDAQQAAPQETRQGRVAGAADQPAGQRRQRQAERDPQEVETVQAHHPAVAQQVGRELAPVLPAQREQPADVRVPDAAQAPAEMLAVQARRMRVAFLVGEGVVHAVRGGPEQDRPLRGHRAGDREQRRHHRAGLEGLVREEAMQPRLDAERGDQVHHREQADLEPADAVHDRQRRGRERADRRDPDREPGQAPFGGAGAIGERRGPRGGSLGLDVHDVLRGLRRVRGDSSPAIASAARGGWRSAGSCRSWSGGSRPSARNGSGAARRRAAA